MVRWIADWLARFVQLGLDLAAALIRGFFAAPGAAARRAATVGTVRRAAPADVIDVRHRVLREGKPRETAIFDGDDLASTRHWVVDHDGRVIGAVTVLAAPMPDPPPGAGAVGWQLRGMAVLPEHRGAHLGRALLDATHREVAAPMWCNARAGVVGFYEAAGWRAVGAPFDVPGIGPHRRMWWPGPNPAPA